MPIYIDQTGRTIEIPRKPERIISLVPSQTELLGDLGLEEQLVGITKFCIHPTHIFRTKTRVGGTKKVDHKIIESLKPDLIIANKEENTISDIQNLEKKYPVWVSEIYSIEDALEMIAEIGSITDSQARAESMVQEITKRFAPLDYSNAKQYSTAYFIWKNPLMCAGTNTFIHNLLQKIGLKNIFSDQEINSRYPSISPEQLKNIAPDVILLSSEPYPFKVDHVEEFKAICPNATILTVDGERFTWYGSRMLKMPAYLNEVRKKIDFRVTPHT